MHSNAPAGTTVQRTTIEESSSYGVYATQGALWCESDRGLWKALSVAHPAVRRSHPASQLATMAWYGMARCPSCRTPTGVWRNDDVDVVVCGSCGTSFDALTLAGAFDADPAQPDPSPER